MISINITKAELMLGIGLTHKLRNQGFTQFEGFTRVQQKFLGQSIIAECYPTLKDLLTMNFDRIRKELKR
jgi:hypothetical protein